MTFVDIYHQAPSNIYANTEVGKGLAQKLEGGVKCLRCWLYGFTG